MKHTHNPDNRTNDSEVIKTKINNTRHNAEIASEIISKTDDDKLKVNLKEKNITRKEAVNHLRKEIDD